MTTSAQSREPDTYTPGMVLKVVKVKGDENQLQTYGMAENQTYAPSMHRGSEKLLVLTAPEIIRGNEITSGQLRIMATLQYVTVVKVRGVGDRMKIGGQVELLRVQGNALKRQVIPRVVDSGDRVDAVELARIKKSFNL